MSKFTEIIDKYLSGQMSADEKKDFEKQLEINSELKAEYNLQVQVMKGVQRAGIKQSVNRGLHKASVKSKLLKWATAIVITAVATTLVFVVKDKLLSSKENIRYELNEENKKQWSDADKNLTPQVFKINGEADTVIETINGIVVAIPAGAFYNKHGEVVKDNIEIEIKEALTPSDIMLAGLSTTSDGRLLETGGMFYVNARQNGENLTVAQNKGLYMNIPTNNIRKDMMLFEGQRLDNGQINWTTTKPFENKLSTVDILSLNFYPPHFLDSLQAFGYNIKNKMLTDSIYYSLVCSSPSQPAMAEPVEKAKTDSISIIVGAPFIADTFNAGNNLNGKALFQQNCAVCHFSDNRKLTGPGLGGIENRVPKGSWLLNYIKNNEKMIKSGDAYINELHAKNGYGAMPIYEKTLTDAQINAIISYIENGNAENLGKSECEISPSRIQAIWNKKFNNTILATKEFEERLQVIFATCNASIFNLYIQNMNKKMYEIDSMAMGMVSSDKPECYHKFEEFYNRRDGGVAVNEKHIQKLKTYVEEKTKLYKEVATQTLNKMYADEEKKDAKQWDNQFKHQIEDMQRKGKVFLEEYNINLKEAYRQLDKPLPVFVPGKYYGVTVQTLGWKNVDAYVNESTINRTTLDYTDSSTGKKAVIKYEPFSITVNNHQEYDQVFSYLLTDKLSSFQRIPNTGNIYKENLNELLNYSVVVMAFKNNKVYYKQFANVKPGSSTINLDETTKEKLKALLGKYEFPSSNTSSEMVKDLYYNVSEQKEIIRHKAIAKREEIRRKLMKLIYPCYVNQERATESDPFDL